MFELQKKHDEVTPDAKKVMFINPILDKEIVVPVKSEEVAKEVIED